MRSQRVQGKKSELQSVIRELDSSKSIKGILLLVADNYELEPENINSVLTSISTPIFGGIFPEVLYEGNTTDAEAIAIGIQTDLDITIIEGLDSPTKDFSNELRCKEKFQESSTAFVFVDGFANRIEDFITSIFNTYGISFNYIGGGAGSLEMGQKPVLFTDNGVLEGAGIIAVLNTSSTIGVKHGWEKVEGPLRVTKSEDNTIHELSDRQAFSVYKQIIEDDSEKQVTKDNFFEIAKQYPFGVDRIDGEMIVRDPFEVNEDGSLTCFGNIPEEEFIYVLRGERDQLIEAAEQSYEKATTHANTGDVICFDCISRTQYLKDAFEDELNVIGKENEPTVGALTIGEVANGSDGYLSFYNKTVVTSLVDDI